jgi:hypothetical protein
MGVAWCAVSATWGIQQFKIFKWQYYFFTIKWI